MDGSGQAGSGGGGGSGGYGAAFTAPAQVTAAADLTGGTGGVGGADTDYYLPDAGNGGDGGGGAYFGTAAGGASFTVDAGVSVVGGTGGAGGSPGGSSGNAGAAGDGGSGVVFIAQGSVTNAGTLRGGDGGHGGDGVVFNDGGSGSSNRITNTGTIVGGDGQGNSGGAGIIGSSLIVDASASTSVIQGGFSNLNGTGARADAIDFTGGANSLTLGGTLAGNVGVDGTGTALSFDQTAAATLTNVITGTGSIIDGGTGLLTLSGADTYSGGTTVASGSTLQIGDGGTTGSILNTSGIADSGTLAFDRSDAITFTQAITGSGGLSQVGAGALTLTTAQNYMGSTTIASGSTLQLGDGGVAGSIANTSSIADDGTLAVDQSGTLTLGKVISGTGAIDVTGSGTTVLTAANTYSGGTALSGGTLELGQQTSAGTGAITFGAAGETLKIDTTGTLDASSVTGFEANDAIDLAALNASGATASYASGKLTVSGTPAAGGAAASEAITIAPAPAGQEYTISADANGHAVVKLAAIPAPTITAPANGTDTNNNEPTISGTGENGDTVILTLSSPNGTSFTAGATVANGTWSITPQGALADGSYSATATEMSPSGTGMSAASNAETFTIDTTAPAAPSTPADAAVMNGYVNAANDTANQTVTGTAEAGSTVKVYDKGTLVDTTATNATTGAWSYQVGTLPNGSQHSYTATATDAANNTSVMSGALAFTVDTTAPTITALADSGPSIDANGNGDLNAGKTVTLTVTTSEAVTVTPGAGGGTPTLSLNDGGVATYTGGSGTAQQTFSYTVAAGQNVAKLAVTGVNANGATATDQAGNPLSTSLMGAAVPSGTLTIDTTPPTASSVTDTVAQGSGPVPIGLGAPSDNLTPAGSLAIAVTGLPIDGTVTLGDGTTAVQNGMMLTAAQLTGLEFTPTPGVSNQGSTFTYTVTDGAGNATTGTAALNVGSAGAPTITGTHASTTTSEAAVTPFSGVTVADPSAASGATDTVTIVLTGAGGALTGAGLMQNANGSYTLAAASPGTITAELDALRFTPTAGAAGMTSTTTFVLTDASSAGTSVTDAGASVADTDPATAPTPGQPSPTPQPTPVAPDAVSLSPQVSYRDGVFTLSGTASSAAGVSSIEISATVRGQVQDLGAATIATDGTFTFADAAGPGVQGFITATETDKAGVATSAQADYSLTGDLGVGAYTARETSYTADGSAVTSRSLFRDSGQRAVDVEQAGQTLQSDSLDHWNNNGAPETTFVFTPGYGQDVVNLFRVGGVDHDTLSFKGSDFGNDIANVLADMHYQRGGAVITDPTTQETVKLLGVTKAQLTANQGDFTFHA